MDDNLSKIMMNDKQLVKFIKICDFDQLKTINQLFSQNITDCLIQLIRNVGQNSDKEVEEIFTCFKKYYLLSVMYRQNFDSVLLNIKNSVIGGNSPSTHKTNYVSRLFNLSAIVSKPVDKDKVDHNLHQGAIARKNKQLNLNSTFQRTNI